MYKKLFFILFISSICLVQVNILYAQNAYLTNEEGQRVFFKGYKMPIKFSWSGAVDADSKLTYGFGFLEIRDGDTNKLIELYEGEMNEGHYNGKGKSIYYFDVDSMYMYDGTWVMDIKEGYGNLTYPNGSVYEGEFKNNNLHGFGTSYDNNNKVLYKGYWKENEACNSEEQC